tara:strand:- start:341 stop:484 length:144 start_codon:yes stop_codon:yes gene_type:complete
LLLVVAVAVAHTMLVAVELEATALQQEHQAAVVVLNHPLILPLNRIA